MDHTKRLLGLEKTLSGLAGYEGWMIAKCRFRFDKKKRNHAGETVDFNQLEDESFAYQMQVLKSDARLAQVCITGENRGNEDSLDVTLIDPGFLSGEKRSEKTLVLTQSIHPSPFFTVTEKEIQSYLQAVNDTNPIHQGKSAIVPGFLMVNKMFEMFQIFTIGSFQVDVRFLTPLQVGEETEVTVKTEDSKKTILFKISERTILKAVVTEI
ncbi:MAG: hypothetical protein ACLS7U_06430 [Enterocloster sp.]